MILSLINNYNIRPCKAQYLWVFYKQIHDFKKNEIHFILDEDYIARYSETTRWEMKSSEAMKHFYIPPSYSDVLSCYHTIFNHESTSTKSSKSTSLKKFMFEHNEQLTHLTRDLVNQKKIKCGLTWVNNTSFKSELKINGIKLIHNELGPLRSPLYKDTCYFDFSGVNGNTEFDSRFQKFILDYEKGKIKLLTHSELLSIISSSERVYKRLLSISESTESKPYQIGLPLQVENDTNIIAFNNDFSIIDLISKAIDIAEVKNVLIRNHPHATLKASSQYYNVDSNVEILEFINRVNEVMTINSSVGFESVLLNKKVTYFGDNPFANSVNRINNEKDRLLFLNFAIISYLVKIEFMYNLDYIDLRLDCNDENILFKEGLNMWSKD
jgi:hypothetical protein